jgi:hypothetical protein
VRLVCLLLLALSSLLAACAVKPDNGVRTSIIGAPVAEAGRASPAVRGAERGLEVWSWIVADRAVRSIRSEVPHEPAPEGETSDDQSIALTAPQYMIVDERLSIELAMSPYIDRPVPLPDHVRFRLHAAGLRIVAVPVSDLARLQRELRLVGPTQRQWLGEIPRWTDIAHGPSSRSRTVAIATGNARLDAGRLRLLGRAWVTPDPAWRAGTLDGMAHDGTAAFLPATLRLELVPQHEPQLSEPQRLLAAASRVGAAEPNGRVFRHLSIGTYMRGEDALVIIPDSPASDWLEAADGDADLALAARPLADAETVSEESPLLSLGEAMLVTPASGTRPRTRTVLVLIPHLPQRFELGR